VRRVFATLAALSALATGLVLGASVPAARAVQTSQPAVVNTLAVGYTPAVKDGVVYAIGQVGSTVFLGGSFTSVTPHGSTTALTQNYITAFTAGTGQMVSSFAPQLDGMVKTIIAGPTPGTVYVAGAFKTVNGVKARVALLDATTGAIVPGWKTPPMDAVINKLVLANGQLFVGGYFTTVNGKPRNGLATLNPTTGALTDYSTLAFTGHHNYGTNCNPSRSHCANGGVGVISLDVNPAGTQLVAIGNFTSVSGSARDQIAVIDLGATTASVKPDWSTLAFSAACSSGSFDSYVRDVQYSPDGSYFVVVATGASGTNIDGTNSSCDTAARYESTGSGANVRPTWIDYTGRDSLWAVAVSGTAVYVGGHERWLNNSKGSDSAAAGAVPRPGMAALDPINGMPLSWNPGRNPRGAGAYALLATADGLYVGSDTNYIGNNRYEHDKIAFFPLYGGATLAPTTTGTLPGNVYLGGGSAAGTNLRSVKWDGSTPPTTPKTLTATGIDWSTVRGAFDIAGTVYYGATDGNLYQRSFDGKVFGAATLVDPYDDPAWATVSTGSGQTYRGVKSGLYSELPSVTSMFYSAGRVYYTLNNRSQMFWRWFEPDSGIAGSDEFTVNDGQNWTTTRSAFLVGNTLYFATSSGALDSVAFVNGQASGTPVLVDSSMNWASNGAFVVSAADVHNQAPIASFTVDCGASGTHCTFDASSSTDPDGNVVSYAWSFGDGQTETDSTNHTTHDYATDGSYSVTLTVTDDDAGTANVTHTVHLDVAPPAAIQFVNSATKYANATSESLTIPADTAAGDGMLLFDTFTRAGGTASSPAGWTEVGRNTHGTQTTIVYDRVATAADAGSAVQVTYSLQSKATLTLATYSGTDTTNPVQTVNSATAGATASETAPALSGLSDGTVVVSFWADRSSATTSLTPPATVTQRAQQFGAGSATVNALLADSGAPVSGAYAAQTATTNDASPDSSSWSVALQQSST
jgi:hypothetical protein